MEKEIKVMQHHIPFVRYVLNNGKKENLKGWINNRVYGENTLDNMAEFIRNLDLETTTKIIWDFKGSAMNLDSLCTFCQYSSSCAISPYKTLGKIFLKSPLTIPRIIFSDLTNFEENLKLLEQFPLGNYKLKDLINHIPHSSESFF